MKLNCINCGSPIAVENLNIEKTIAVCPNCSEVFNFSGQVPARKTKKVAQPADITVEEGHGQLQITVEPPMLLRGKKLQFAAGIFFMTLAAGLYVAAVEANGGVNDGEAWLRMGLIFIPLMLIMLGVIYNIMATAWNEIKITLNDNGLRVKYSPFPMIANSHFTLDQIKSVQAKEEAIHETYIRYSVEFTLKDGFKLKLLNELKRDQAYFIAQELESYLYGETETEDDLFEADEVFIPQHSRLQSKNG